MTSGRGGRSTLILACFALAHILLLTVVYHTVVVAQYSGVRLFFDFSSRLVAGQVPYRDFPLEYPPFALVFYTLPRLVSSTLERYYVAFQVEVVAFDLVGLAAIHVIAERANTPTWQALLGYTIAIVAVGPIVGQQYDIFPAILTLLALACFCTDHDDAAWVFLALGVLTKLYPILLAPLFLMARAGARPRKYMVRAAIVGVVTCVVATLPLLLVAPTSFRTFFAYHARRGIQLESTYATVILLADRIGLTIAGTGVSFGSWNVTGSLAGIMSRVSTVILIAALVGAYAFVRARWRGPHDVESISTSALLVLLVALLASKVFSPQYLIWVVPFLPFSAWSYRTALWTLFAVAGVVTYYIFPMHYPDLITGATSAELALLLRNLLIAACAAVTAASLRRAGARVA